MFLVRVSPAEGRLEIMTMRGSGIGFSMRVSDRRNVLSMC